MSIKVCFIFAILAFISGVSHSGVHTGLIEKIDIHGESWTSYDPSQRGVIGLFIKDLPRSCNEEDGLRRVVIKSDHPLFNSVLSLAISSQAMNKPVTVNYLESCNVRSRAWDFGTMSLSL